MNEKGKTNNANDAIPRRRPQLVAILESAPGTSRDVNRGLEQDLNFHQPTMARSSNARSTLPGSLELGSRFSWA